MAGTATRGGCGQLLLALVRLGLTNVCLPVLRCVRVCATHCVWHRAVILLNLALTYRLAPWTWSKYTRVQASAPPPAGVLQMSISHAILTTWFPVRVQLVLPNVAASTTASHIRGG